MAGISESRETFIIQILGRQNCSWQGTIKWTTSEESQSFRSALELIRLIGSALGDEKEEGA